MLPLDKLLVLTVVVIVVVVLGVLVAGTVSVAGKNTCQYFCSVHRTAWFE